MLLRSLTTPQQAGISIKGLGSKGNDVFKGNPPDIVITVCDKAAGEGCSVYLGPALNFSGAWKIRWIEAGIGVAFRATLAPHRTALQGLLFESLG